MQFQDPLSLHSDPELHKLEIMRICKLFSWLLRDSWTVSLIIPKLLHNLLCFNDYYISGVAKSNNTIEYRWYHGNNMLMHDNIAKSKKNVCLWLHHLSLYFLVNSFLLSPWKEGELVVTEFGLIQTKQLNVLMISMPNH